MKTMTPAQAAAELGISRREVVALVERGALRRGPRIAGAYFGQGLTVLAADVAALVRKQEAKRRRTAIGEAQRLIVLDAKIAEDERWLRTYGPDTSTSERLEKNRAYRREFAGPSSRSSTSSASCAELRGQAAAIAARYDAREAARRPAAARAGSTRREDRFSPRGEDRLKPISLPANLRAVLIRFAKTAHRGGRAYTTTVDLGAGPVPVALLPDGRFVTNA